MAFLHACVDCAWNSEIVAVSKWTVCQRRGVIENGDSGRFAGSAQEKARFDAKAGEEDGDRGGWQPQSEPPTKTQQDYDKSKIIQ